MKFLKTLLIALMTLNMLNVMANEKITTEQSVNKQCIEIYQRGTIDLATASRDFNARTISAGQFSARVALTRTKVGAIGFVCKNTQQPNKVKCIKALEKNYDKLNAEISIMDILSDKQDLVSISIIDAAEGLLNHGRAILTCVIPSL
jgi:hypothetical protein